MIARIKLYSPVGTHSLSRKAGRPQIWASGCRQINSGCCRGAPGRSETYIEVALDAASCVVENAAVGITVADCAGGGGQRSAIDLVIAVRSETGKVHFDIAGNEQRIRNISSPNIGIRPDGHGNLAAIGGAVREGVRDTEGGAAFIGVYRVYGIGAAPCGMRDRGEMSCGYSRDIPARRDSQAVGKSYIRRGIYLQGAVLPDHEPRRRSEGDARGLLLGCGLVGFDLLTLLLLSCDWVGYSRSEQHCAEQRNGDERDKTSPS